MRKKSSTTITTLIQRSVFRAVLLILVIACFLSFIYGFVQYYKQQRLQVQQLAELLVISASTVDGASLVAQQVEVLLDKDPTLSSIVFYSSDSPIIDFDQNEIEQFQDWYNAFFAESISFNNAVTSRYLSLNSYNDFASLHIDQNQISSIENDGIGSTNSLETQEVLVGYINITLDINKLRLLWLQQNALMLFAIILVMVIGLLLVLRRLIWSASDVSELSKVCQTVVSNPDVEQLPVIQQRFNLIELRDIRLALITLFNRSKTLREELDALAAFEQQLYNKDLSLDVQRGNFQSMITHELKTSLNAISGGLQLLDGKYTSAEQKDTLAIVHKGSQHLEATIEQIIQLNKIEKGKMSINFGEFNPLQLLSDIFTEFEGVAKQKGLTLSSRINHIDYKLKGDANKIKQILASLLDNAIKFTDSGEIIVESKLTHFNKNIRWEIMVSDTGIGIDKKYIKDIFVPFFQVDPSRTRNYEGVGVGLPVLSQIVKLLGAAIEVTSEPNVGSQFTVILPLQIAYQNDSQQSQQALIGLNVLYYHNDEMGVMVEQLQRFGARVTNSQHDLSVIRKITNEKVDIVMIGQEVMPEKAISLAQLIRAQETGYRVLIIYWYPAHKSNFLNAFEYSLKAAGVDFCYPATQNSKALYDLLKDNLSRHGF